MFGGEPDYLREFGYDAVRVGQFAKYRPGFQLCNGYQVRVFFRCLSRANTLPAGRCGPVGRRIVRFAGGVCSGYRRRQSERIRSLVSIVCCHAVDSVFESSPC